MNIKKLLCLVSAAALATSVTASAQSLVDLARHEKQRRAKLRSAGVSPARLYTDGDKSGSAAETGAATAATADSGIAAGASSGTAAGPKKKEKTPEELAAEKQKEWNEKVQKAQDEIRELESTISTNERNLASLINITPARADLANRIEADKKKLAELKQTLVTLEEERRRAGMPRR